MYKLYNVGARTEPCVTPACVFLGVESLPSTETLDFLLDRYELMSLIKLVGNCNFDSSYSKSRCHVVSKAFLIISKNTAAVDILLLKFRVM